MLKLKIHFESKLILIQWRELDKIHVHTIYNLQFFNGHRASCLWFIKHYQTKENWKNNAMPTYTISSSLMW